MSLPTAELPEIFIPRAEFGAGGYITVDAGDAAVQDIPVAERRTVAELFPDKKGTSIADHIVAAVIRQPEDFIIVPPIYARCEVRKKTAALTREEALQRALSGDALVVKFLAEDQKT